MKRRKEVRGRRGRNEVTARPMEVASQLKVIHEGPRAPQLRWGATGFFTKWVRSYT
jgi:hypothetical protein